VNDKGRHVNNSNCQADGMDLGVTQLIDR